MVDNDALGKLFNAATGVWALVCLAVGALFKAWPHIMGRANERHRDIADQRAADWERVRAERDRLRLLLVECEKERVEWMGRAIRAEATLQGYGELRQIRAISEASKRVDKSGGE